MKKFSKFALGISLLACASAAMADKWTCDKFLTSNGSILIICKPQ